MSTSPAKESLVQKRLGDGIALYVHIPFCKTKCPYCDFNTYQGIEPLMAPYTDALAREIRLWGMTLEHPKINTIFFGGGTPSYIPTDDLGRILDTIHDCFDLDPQAEITVEANPGDLSLSGLEQLHGIGVNRLSIGVQSLDSGLLSLLGRRHSAQEAVGAYELATEAGFKQVNLDLIYGLPRQTMAQWKDTLSPILELRPPHLSMYCLTLEKGTPLEQWVSQGKLPQPDPDLAADMYIFAGETLGKAGYDHYEISNWCMPGYECLHNMAYWLNQPYLGVGPGAHSFIDGYRFWQIKPPRLYIDKVGDWEAREVGLVEKLDAELLAQIDPIGGFEAIEPKLEMAETMFLGLRLLEGMDMDSFRQRFGLNPSQVYISEIRELTDLGLLEQEDGVLRLTPNSCLLSNQVFMRFLD